MALLVEFRHAHSYSRWLPKLSAWSMVLALGVHLALTHHRPWWDWFLMTLALIVAALPNFRWIGAYKPSLPLRLTPDALEVTGSQRSGFMSIAWSNITRAEVKRSVLVIEVADPEQTRPPLNREPGRRP
jgi:hypothetical protein